MTRAIRFLYILAFFFLAGGSAAKAQFWPPNQPEQDPCNAIALCGTSWSTPNSYQGFGALQFQTQFTACHDEANSVWLRLNITTPGNIVFTITPNNATNDYDFSVFNLSSPLATCNTFTAANRIRCNGVDIASSPGGLTGLNSTSIVTTSGPGPGVPFLQQLTVTAGQTYLILVDNFGPTPFSGFTIDFAGSSATFGDIIAPTITGILPSCGYNNEVTLTLSKPIKCSSIAANGSDFTIAGGTISGATGVGCLAPTGFTSQVTLTFAPPLAAGAYTITSAVGSDANTLLDGCNNALAIGAQQPLTVTANTPPVMTSVVTPACNSARVLFGPKFKCSSIALNGSDFSVTGPEAVTVTSAKVRGCASNPANAQALADTVDLTFSKSIFTPGTYTITTKIGTDGNSVIDTCNRAVNNPVTFVVSDAGLVTADVDPDVLCEPGYVNLNSAPPYPLPPSTVACGPLTGNLPTGTPTTYAIGTGVAGIGTNSPFYSFWHDSRSQFLYRASELQAAGLSKGTLTGMSWTLTQKNSTMPFTGFTIKISCTNANVLPTNGYEPGVNTIVYTGTYTSAVGINNFVFNTPYNWDGISNLIVEVCFDNTAYSFTGNDLTTYTITPFISTYLRFMDGGSGCNTSTLLLSQTGDQTTRPNITFTHLPPPPSTFDQKWTPSLYVEDTTDFTTRAYVPATTTFQIQIIDSNGCYRRATDQVIVSVRNPELYSNDTSICIGESTPLHAGPATSYFWYPQDGSLSCTDCADPIATPITTTTYSVVLFDQYGCSDTLSVTVFVDPLPVVDAGRDTSFQYGEGVPLYVSAPGGRYYQWDPPFGLNNANIVDPIANPENNTTYQVLVIDTNGCVSGDSVRVRVIKDAEIGIPDAFTPNADGVNDEFRVALLRYQRVTEFRVFDRWGRQVWATNSGNGAMSRGWNGRYPDGTEAASGTYNYLLRIVWPDGKSKMYKGTVLLLR